jgi:hypothetical protein
LEEEDGAAAQECHHAIASIANNNVAELYLN